MNIKKVYSLFILLLLVVPVFSHADDNDINVASTMREILGEVKNINKAFTAEDYYTTATHFMKLARLFKSLESVFPEKEKKETWDRIHNEIIKESFIAIGACALEDNNTITKSLENISLLQKEGHKLFK